ncbi:MAG: alpha-amylase family glycosyl hydrolase, partial [Gaiellales bacterium]
ALEHRHSRNVLETLRPALAALRAAAGSAFLVGEAYVPTEQLPPYLEHLDSAFAFEFLFAPWRAEVLAGVIDRAAGLGRAAWVLSNHDFGRLGSRVGEANQRAAALLLLTLPGPPVIYQGDEIGLMDGPGADPPVDRFGRDRARHPMQWDATRSGGFSDGSPWLPVVDPAVRNVADQRRDPGSLLSFHRALLRLRRELDGPVRLLEAGADGLLMYARGTHVMALNLGSVPRRVDLPGEVVLATHPDATPALLAPSAGIVVRSAASRPGDPVTPE